MTTDNMFEKASRLALIFDTPNGALSTEDLWNLPLTSKSGRANLDDIAKGLHQELKADAVSFVVENAHDEVTELRFEIVEHIIAVRLEERRTAEEARDKAERKQQLLALVSEKESEELRGKSVEELRAMIEAL